MIKQLEGPDRGYDYAAIETKLVGGLKEYCENARQKGFVIGVSGGIDSAVVSTLCAKTGLDLTVLTMPIHQTVDEVDRANDHIAWLKQNRSNVIVKEVDLTNTYETIKAAMELTDDSDLSLVNTRSRLRAVTLYAEAAIKKALVAGTGNKVEDFGIGFFTKYGDGAVDISPIGGLVKSETRKLGQHMGVIESIVQAAPTDGLHPNGATDEDQIGATYDELEWAMDILHDEAGNDKFDTFDCALQQFPEGSREQTVLSIYRKRHIVNAHKMIMPPILPIY